MRTTLLFTSALVGLTSLAQAQILASDDFDFTGAATDNGWSAHSGGGNRVIMSNGMFATLDQQGGSGEDINLPFSLVQGDTETTYASFAFRIPSGNPLGVDNPDANGLYFAHLKDSGFSFRARTGIVQPTGGGDFGLAIHGSSSGLGGGTTWGSDLSFDTWYTVVISWDASTGEGKLWVDPANETSTSVSHIGTSTGNEIEQFALRQSNDWTGLIDIDTVRAGKNFCDVLPAGWDTDFGASLGVPGDDTTTDVTLGFMFPFPDGTSTDMISIDSNGRFFPMGADTSDFGETVGEFLGQTTLVAPYWDDLTPAGLGTGDMYFRTDANEALITWDNVVRFNGSTEFSFQCKIYPDGRTVFSYDDRVPASNDALVGVSEGNGVADPGGVDLRLTTSSGLTVYEQFFAGDFDLTDGSVQFVPDGVGFCVSNTLPPQPIDGTATKLAKPCDVSLNFAPDGSGGYNVTKIPAMWVDDSSLSPVELATGLGDDALTAVQTLGHSFPGPGATWTSIKIDNNGVIHDGAGTETTGDFNPSVGDLTSDDSKIAAFWTDLSSQNGSLRFATTATFSTVTWENVPQFAETNAHSFQAVLNDDGSFQLNYRDTSEWRTGSGFTSDDVLIGCSQGGGATAPAESNYSQYAIATAGDATVYEFWDATNNENPDVQPRLLSTATPQLGGSIELALDGLSAVGTATTLLIGFTNPNVPVDAIGGCGCTLSAANDAPIALAPVDGAATFSLPLPNNPGFVGLLNIYFQGAYFAAENDLGIVLTEGQQISF